MSISAPRGLASSGQKPITDIPHPLSAADEPLSIPVNAGGEKVHKAGGEGGPGRAGPGGPDRGKLYTQQLGATPEPATCLQSDGKQTKKGAKSCVWEEVRDHCWRLRCSGGLRRMKMSFVAPDLIPGSSFGCLLTHIWIDFSVARKQPSI